MPYVKGTAISLQDLLDKTVVWATDATIHGDDAWELMRNDPWPRGTIFKAKGVNGVGNCYIGIMLVNHVQGASYRNWLLQTKNLAKYVVWGKDGLNLGNVAFTHTNGSSSFSVLPDSNKPSSQQVDYSLYNIDIVNASCTALVFGVFKQYEDGLDWNEQPGSIEFRELAQYPIQYSMYGSKHELKAPIYPGVGYPGFGLPAGQPLNSTFKFWIVKDGSRITIVINNQDQWDMGHAGMLIPFHAKMQYAFPAVVAGSCTGLKTVADYGDPYGTRGGKVDYSYDNNSISRSMPCAPGISLGTKTPENSQIGLCLPDGQWRFISNWTQELIRNTGGNFELKRPVKTTTGCKLKPTDNDLTDVVSVLTDDNTITIESFDLFQGSTGTSNANMLGSLWNMYWPGADGPYGEVKINNKKHLMLPNCWEGRSWYIPLNFDQFLTPEGLLAADKEIIKFSKQFRMLIKLED